MNDFLTHWIHGAPFCGNYPGQNSPCWRTRRPPLLTQQNAWLKLRYGHEFCDESLRFEEHLLPLEDEALRFLVARAPSAPPLILGILADYLAGH